MAADVRDPHRRSSSPPPRRESDRFFWNDLYWFLVATLAAAIVALLVLPPRMHETVGLLRKERQTLDRIAALRREERVLAAAIEAVQNDPVYREGVIRNVFHLRRKTEEFLEPPPPSFPITPIEPSSP